MKTIMTVNGKIKSEKLGFCHYHEHLSIDKGESYKVNSALCIDETKQTLEEVKSFYSAGGRAIVDAQPVGCGRNALALRELSCCGNINIIASTGFHKLQFYKENHWICSFSLEELTSIFIDELESGMYINCDDKYPSEKTNICAGNIKMALDCGKPGEIYQKLFLAGIKASVKTGAPIMVHIEQGANPLWLVDFLEFYGANLNKVVFCHMDRSVSNINTHLKIGEKGICMEYDTIARPRYHDDMEEIRIIKKVVSSGLDKQILMGLDVTRDRMRSYGGGPGLDYIQKTFIPLLMEKGITEETIYNIFTQTPARLLGRE